MSATYLDSILEYHRARVVADGRDWRERSVKARAGSSLRTAMVEHRALGLSVIAEVKRRSPSRGWIAQGASAALVAGRYEAGGATAVSVLTDDPHFGGCLEDLREVASEVAVPVLRKDFVLCENDVLDAAECGAIAVLLIVAALREDELAGLLGLCESVGLDALVEVHDVPEARRAVGLGATVVGVNRRDLRTFEVDQRRASRVVSGLPAGVVTVAESGFSAPDDARAAAGDGFDAILVGEHLITSVDPAQAVRELVGFPIAGR